MYNRLQKLNLNKSNMKKTLSLVLAFVLVGMSVFSKNQADKCFKPKEIKKAMIKAAMWQFANPKHELWDWTNGAFYAGVSAAYQTTGDTKLLDAMNKMGEANHWKPGPRLQHADDIAICQTYIDMFRIKKDRSMIQPFIENMDKFLVTPFPVKGIEKITWWWCDALFMAPPALVKLSMTTGDKKYMEKSDELFHETYNLLYDKEEHLFARDLGYVIKGDASDRHEANGKKIFWSRGNGWVMGGLALLLNELPKDYKERSFYEQVYKEMAEKVASLQQEDGLWRASLLDPASYPGGEASGSGFYTFALAWGINNGLLSKDKYLQVVQKAWKGMNSLIQSDGHVGWCQPIGADPKKNFSADSWEVYGTGAFLLAGSEVIKLKK
ncbi:rhamnogalacturonides degradation protein RhiN [Aquipluma nitroreducens]|uniref:Rhamnogalacturonides degradation protein RhiN n=2 Tax=Aquipluma nitroreducens TaxID=2010828 RepID=A0A5K7S6C6_9BACT|nr:rhamnogalacturonides degradation protein RhiN [Aquipluma nitroreducens]